ncbi:MAG: NAD(+)/NADH kinase [Chloroflexi bacterium]|nr:NAD(+)/NADH kinase [Chloroflexota bacterium]
MMQITNFSLKSIAIVSHPQAPQADSEAARITAYLKKEGIKVEIGTLYDEKLRSEVEAGRFDAIIALGGDGTMLRVGHLCAPCGIPVLGINLGHFGFLMEVRQNQWMDVFPRLLEGDFWLEQRMMLCAELYHQENLLGKWEVLNEVVVGRGKAVRPVHLITHVDGRFLTTYVADALIAATATGSTAYAMAAGGPILPPELRNILLVPVAPHLSIDRAIMLSEGSNVSITVETSHQAMVCIDGQTPVDMENNDIVNVHASDHTAQFIRFQDPGYFYRNLTPHMNQNPSTGASR